MRTTLFILSLMIFNVSAYDLSDIEDGEFLSIAGKVLKYKDGDIVVESRGKKINVELDDINWKAQKPKLFIGQEVAVTGTVDKDLLEEDELDAQGIYFRSYDKHFHARDFNLHEDHLTFIEGFKQKDISNEVRTDLSGKVIKVDGKVIVIDTGIRKVNVDTNSVNPTPLYTNGNWKIKEGDQVIVSGLVDKSYYSSNRLDAITIRRRNNQEVNLKKNGNEKIGVKRDSKSESESQKKEYFSE